MENKVGELNISLDLIIKEFDLDVFYTPVEPEKIIIHNNDVNRPGLQFAGHYEYFDNTRIQIVGKAEMAFMEGCTSRKKRSILTTFMSTKPPVIILTRGMGLIPELEETAKKHEVPILGTQENTSVLVSKLIAFLGLRMAPRITRHGALIEVYGEGVLILGESGVGKSETTIELVKRGHRLVADDAVEIRKTSNITLVGSAPDNIRHFMELRGIGIINARQLFGIGAVKLTERLDIVVELELWDSEKIYDRMGLDNHFMSILGVKVPHLVIPVKPGRNLAVILEVAAMNNRQKKMGYNAAQDLMEQLGLNTQSETIVTEWTES